MPHLAQRHGTTQLIVDGQPFLMRAGELENSSASSLPYLDTLWPRLEAMHFNAVIAPVYWNLIEPQQGQFDFSTVDGLIEGARAHDMRLVLLWFGSWKNSMSSYVPAWVKRGASRYPRARRSDDTPMEILSALEQANLQADSAAFVALMTHLKQTDSGPAADAVIGDRVIAVDRFAINTQYRTARRDGENAVLATRTGENERVSQRQAISGQRDTIW